MAALNVHSAQHQPVCATHSVRCLQARTLRRWAGAWRGCGRLGRWWIPSCPTCAGAMSSPPSAPSTHMPPWSGKLLRKKRQWRQPWQHREQLRRCLLCPSRYRQPWRTRPVHRPLSKSRLRPAARLTDQRADALGRAACLAGQQQQEGLPLLSQDSTEQQDVH